MNRRLHRVWWWFTRIFGGHIRLGRITIFGFNAMHWATNIRTRNWGYICFRPTTWDEGWWHWYFYISPDATPQMAYVAFGPGVEKHCKQRAWLRRNATDYARWHPDAYVFGPDGISRSREGGEEAK